MYKKTILPNGLRVVTHDMKERDSIALGFWIGVGGRYEMDKQKGAAHFIEHILFKGTKKYSCEAIKEKIEGVGGALNAFTSEEQTCFFARIPSKHLEQTFDVLSDMILHPLITAEDTAKEGAVIIEEIKMYHDLPQYFVMELLDELLWPDHPLGKNLAGTKETISSMTHEDLRAFHERYYTADNMVVSVCGRLKHPKIVGLVKRKMEKMPKSQGKRYIPADNSQNAPRVKFFKKEIEQMHLVLGTLGFDEWHKDRHAMTLLNIILGGNMSSRLFVELREKRGLAYSISTAAKCMHDTGVFLVRAGVDNQKIVESLELILKELKKIKEEGVKINEFTRAKDYLLGQFLLGLEDTMDHMLWIGESVVSKNELKGIKIVVQEFERIKRADIQRVAREILDERKYNLAVVGPISDAQEREMQKFLQLK